MAGASNDIFSPLAALSVKIEQTNTPTSRGVSDGHVVAVKNLDR